jgi:hypothetical protein
MARPYRLSMCPSARWHDVVMDVVSITKSKRPVGSGVWAAYVLGVDNSLLLASNIGDTDPY